MSINIEKTKVTISLSEKVLKEENIFIDFDFDFGNSKIKNNICPVCEKQFKRKKSLKNHLYNKHLIDYNIFLKNVEKESPIDLNINEINFKINILNLLKIIDKSVCRIIKNEVNNIQFNRYIDREFMKSHYIVDYSITLLSYVRVYYQTLMFSNNFVKDIYNYIFEDEIKIIKRKKKKVEGLCFICDYDKATDNHHLFPISYGGKNKEYNMIPVCSRCHKRDPFDLIFKEIKETKGKEKLKNNNLKINIKNKISKKFLKKLTKERIGNRIKTSEKYQQARKKGTVGRSTLPKEIVAEVKKKIKEGKSYRQIHKEVTYKAKHGKVKHVSVGKVSSIAKEKEEAPNSKKRGS